MSDAAPTTGTAGGGERRGCVYLLHFEHGLPVTGRRIARHYIGWTDGAVETRVKQHLAGVGSQLVAAIVASGQRVTLARTWTGVDRHFERRLKRRHEAPRLCPRCVAAGLTNGRGPLTPEVA
jgi:hypothetical protein